MAKRGTYFGGSGIVRTAPVAIEFGSKRTRKNKDTNRSYESMMLNNQRIEAAQQALRVPRNDSEHARLIGENRHDWSIYKIRLVKEFSVMNKCQIHSADQISKVWKRKGFKTGAGIVWTPDLVGYARNRLNN